MIRRIAFKIFCLLVVCTLALTLACGNISMFTSHHEHIYGNDDNKRRIAGLESRLTQLEQKKKAAVTATPTPTPTPEPSPIP